MHDRRDDYEPIIAPRRPRYPQRDETQPLWRVVLGLLAVVVAAGAIAWWWIGRSPSDGASTAQSEGATSEAFPETEVEQEVIPPARDAETSAEVPQRPSTPQPAAPEPVAEPKAEPEQAIASENVPEVVPENEPAPVVPNEPEPTVPPTSVAVRFMSPDPQVQFQLRRQGESAAVLTAKAGEVVDVPHGTYRVVVSGAQLEKLEQDVTFDGELPLEYNVELCAQPKYEQGSVAGQVVESRTCASTEECESLFTILGEYADELVRDRTFRTEQCAKWRPGSAPDGSWTLNIRCDGTLPSTTCRIEIAEGSCMHSGPRRSTRGGTCPRAQLN